MSDTFFIRRGEKIFGPVNTEQLRQHLAAGNIVDSDEVAASQDGPWHLVSSVPGLSPGAAGAAPAEQAPGSSSGSGSASPPVKQQDASPPVKQEAPPTVSNIGGSKVAVHGRPSFAHIRVELGPGETIIGEADAMASMAGEMDLKAKLNGGFFSGLAKKFLGGESLFINHYTNNTERPLPLVLAPGTPGDIRELTLEGESFCLQPGAFIACTPGVKLGTKWAGFASLIGREGLFKLQVSGHGTVWYGAFGALVEREIDGQFIVDTGHLVGYEPHMKLKVQLAGGIFSSFFGGEGLVTRRRRQGQDHHADALAGRTCRLAQPVPPGLGVD